MINRPEDFANNLMQRFRGLGYSDIVCKLLSKHQLRDMQILAMLHFSVKDLEFQNHINFLNDTEKIIDSIN